MSRSPKTRNVNGAMVIGLPEGEGGDIAALVKAISEAPRIHHRVCHQGLMTSLIMVIDDETSAEDARETIVSMIENTEGEVQVVVVDNGVSSASMSEARRSVHEFDKLTIVDTSYVIPLFKAMGFGAQLSDGDVMAFVRPGTQCENGAVDQLSNRVRETDAIVCPTTIVSGDGLDYREDYGYGLKYNRDRGWFSLQRITEASETDIHRMGVCLDLAVMSRHHYGVLSGFPNIPFERDVVDTVFSLRAWQAGIEIRHEVDARIYLPPEASASPDPEMEAWACVYAARMIFSRTPFDDLWVPQLQRVYPQWFADHAEDWRRQTGSADSARLEFKANIREGRWAEELMDTFYPGWREAM